MEIFPLFIRKSSAIVLLAALILLPVVAVAAAALIEESTLKSIPSGPVRIHRTSKYIWAEYCPDNTCDVIRCAARIPEAQFKILAAGYYYYFSKYEYLADWQRDVNVGMTINGKLRSIASEECLPSTEKDLARCEIVAASRKNSVQILFIRYDERQGVAQQLKLEEALR